MVILYHQSSSCLLWIRMMEHETRLITLPPLRPPRIFNSVWESMKKYSRLCSEAGTRGLISREARGLQAAKSCTRAERAGELNSHASWSTTGQKSRLAIQLARGLNSQLSQVARSSRQPALFWKNWLFAFHSHTSINTPHSHKICVAIQKEKP